MLVGASDDALKWHTSDAIPVGEMLSLQSLQDHAPVAPRADGADAGVRGILNDVTYRGARFRIVLSVFSDDPDDAPTTEAARNDYCTYVRNTLARYRRIDDVVIWNEPNLSRFWRPQYDAAGVSAAPAAYEALLARSATTSCTACARGST